MRYLLSGTSPFTGVEVMGRQLMVAAGVGAGAGVALVAAFRVGAWCLDALVDLYFRLTTRRDLKREKRNV